MLMAFELFLSILLQLWKRLQPLKTHGLNLSGQPHDFLLFCLLHLGQIHTNKEIVFSLPPIIQKILVSRYLDLCGNVLIINQLLGLENKLQQFPDSGETLELVTICNPYGQVSGPVLKYRKDNQRAGLAAASSSLYVHYLLLLTVIPDK